MALAPAANLVNNPVVVFFHSVSVSLIRRLFHQRRPSSYHTEGPPSGRTKKEEIISDGSAQLDRVVVACGALCCLAVKSE